jgi:hypothetical protein
MEQQVTMKKSNLEYRPWILTNAFNVYDNVDRLAWNRLEQSQEHP